MKNINNEDLQTLIDTISESSNVCIDILTEDGTSALRTQVSGTYSFS